MSEGKEEREREELSKGREERGRGRRLEQVRGSVTTWSDYNLATTQPRPYSPAASYKV